jgi:hypothetical protein
MRRKQIGRREEKGKNSPAWDRVLTRCASGPRQSSNAVLLGKGGRDDEVHWSTVSLMVVAATSIACWRGARAWPEVAVAAARSEEILTA